MKLSKEEKHLINTPYVECSEEERLIRKTALSKLRSRDEKKAYRQKKVNEVKKRVSHADNVLSKANVSGVVKSKIAKDIGLYLFHHGKEKQGLEYYHLSIQYLQHIYGHTDHKVLFENGLYSKLCDQGIKISNARAVNFKNMNTKIH